MKGVLREPNLGDKEGCTTGPYRTPTTLGHHQDMESKQLYVIHRNKHREADKLRKQRNMGQMKEPIKTLEKELNEMEIANLSDVEFKPLVIRMLRELTVCCKSIKKKMKARQSEIKKNLQGTNSNGKKSGIQINDLEHKEEINSQPEQNEGTRIQKNGENKETLGHLKSANI